MKINQFIQEADKQEKIKGFDAKTAQFMADLRLRYPNAPDALSALVKAVQQLRDASWGADKKHSAEITKNGNTIDELEDIIDELELRIAGIELDDEENDMRERQLTPGEKRSREANVKKLKKHKGDFEKRYGKDAESVMYAVATKRAKGESVEESEKRWKQTSMSPEAAAKEFGKENVRVKKGALRNGDDMVEVFVEGYYELPPIDRDRYQKRDGLEGPIPTRSGKVVYYDERQGMYYDPDTDMYISYDDFRKLDQENMHKVDKMKQESKSNKKDQLSEGVLDDTDEDGWMAKSQLYKMAKYAIKLHAMIQDTDNLEPWIQAKITRASEDMSSVKHYLEYQAMNPHHEEMPTQEEPVAEARSGVEFGMFSPAGDEQVENLIQDIVNKFDEKAEKASSSQRDALRMSAHKLLLKNLEDLSDAGYDEAMDTDVRQRAAQHLDRGIIGVMDRIDDLGEGHSPHKKGTAKYKKHMAAMHAESAEHQLEKQAIDFFTSIKSKINTTGKK